MSCLGLGCALIVIIVRIHVEILQSPTFMSQDEFIQIVDKNKNIHGQLYGLYTSGFSLMLVTKDPCVHKIADCTLVESSIATLHL